MNNPGFASNIFKLLKVVFFYEQSLGQSLKNFVDPKFFKSKNVFIPDKNFLDLQNFLKIVLMIAHTRKKLLIKYFRIKLCKLAAVLKRHCCHSNYSYRLFRYSF
jgi:hypothetical protein